MPSYQLSKLATTDLGKIADYTLETWGLKQSLKYRDELKEALQTLADHPHLGEKATKFHKDLRRFVFKSHSVFYRQTDSGVFIVRVLGQSMDSEQHL